MARDIDLLDDATDGLAACTIISSKLDSLNNWMKAFEVIARKPENAMDLVNRTMKYIDKEHLADLPELLVKVDAAIRALRDRNIKLNAENAKLSHLLSVMDDGVGGYQEQGQDDRVATPPHDET